MKLKHFSILTLLLPLLCQAQPKGQPSRQGWFLGLDAGVPLSHSSFSSFAQGGPHLGWTSGLNAGYNFNSIIGLEADFGLGQSNMAVGSPCIDANYYLGADGKLYYAAVLGLDSWKFKDFKSRVSYRRYGLSANINILGLIPATAGSRWSLELSPRISAYSTRETMVSFADGSPLTTNNGYPLTTKSASASTTNDGSRRMAADHSTIHFGYGAAIKASYRLSELLSLGLNSRFTALTGKGIDGIPAHGHKTNFIWENSVYLNCDLSVAIRKTLGKLRPDGAEREALASDPLHSRASTPLLSRIPAPAATRFSYHAPAITKAGALAELAPRQPLAARQSVHFALDKWDLSASESRKLHEILESLLADDSLRLTLEGWCDRYGSDEVNMLISRLRAEAVKSWFIGRGIDSARIEACGKGSDKLETNRKKARRVNVQLHRVL